jgi:hypothetical protein
VVEDLEETRSVQGWEEVLSPALRSTLVVVVGEVQEGSDHPILTISFRESVVENNFD